jgi:hypothetical protein
LIRPACSVNYQRGIASDARPKAGLLGPTAIVSLSPEESKAQNDLPQLPDPDGEGRFLWSGSGSTLEVPAVRQAVL